MAVVVQRASSGVERRAVARQTVELLGPPEQQLNAKLRVGAPAPMARMLMYGARRERRARAAPALVADGVQLRGEVGDHGADLGVQRHALTAAAAGGG